MDNLDPTVFSPVRLVKAEETDKSRLLTMLSGELSKDRLEHSEAELLIGANDIYLVYLDETAEIPGHIIVTDYSKHKGSKEIMLYGSALYERPEAFQEALTGIIQILADQNIDHIFLKVQESLDKVEKAVESVGFQKEGLFISNQFLKGEFSFYTVYRYELNESQSYSNPQKANIDIAGHQL